MCNRARCKGVEQSWPARESTTYSKSLDRLVEGGHNVGATFICKIAMDDSYAVLLAHNDDGLIVAVDGK